MKEEKMLTWYNRLYIGNNAKKRADRAIRRLNDQKMVRGIYLITLASNEKNQLDILSAYNLIQPVVYRRCPMVIGIAWGYDEAVELVIHITNESLEKTGKADLRKYLEQG
ncbi:MAG: hypothetical protein MR308_04200 [Lachnospiraceae bacterium]|nr:hypothetical protein [Lachnospiraceae bacterium]